MDLHPDFPIVEGEYRLTPAWVVTLPEPMNKRVEGDSLVFWLPDFTAVVSLWSPKAGQSGRERLEWLRESASPKAFDRSEMQRDGTSWFSYRLDEPSAENHMPAYYCYAVAETEGHVQLAMFFDGEEHAATAKALCEGTRVALAAGVRATAPAEREPGAGDDAGDDRAE